LVITKFQFEVIKLPVRGDQTSGVVVIKLPFKQVIKLPFIEVIKLPFWVIKLPFIEVIKLPF